MRFLDSGEKEKPEPRPFGQQAESLDSKGFSRLLRETNFPRLRRKTSRQSSSGPGRHICQGNTSDTIPAPVRISACVGRLAVIFQVKLDPILNQRRKSCFQLPLLPASALLRLRDRPPDVKKADRCYPATVGLDFSASLSRLNRAGQVETQIPRSFHLLYRQLIPGFHDSTRA